MHTPEICHKQEVFFTSILTQGIQGFKKWYKSNIYICLLMAAFCHMKKDELQLKLNYQINNFSIWRNIYLCYECTAKKVHWYLSIFRNWTWLCVSYFPDRCWNLNTIKHQSGTALKSPRQETNNNKTRYLATTQSFT